MGDILILDATTLWMIAANKAFVYGKKRYELKLISF